jgi:regulator of sirC expression with transglutaminase-like and TPR domain
MSDSDDRYESYQNQRVRCALQHQIEQLEKELLIERERANKFDRLLKAIYDVLFTADSVYYHKIMRFFEGHTD